MVIKVLLLVGIVLFCVIAIRGRTTVRHIALRRLIALLILVSGCVAVLFPGLVTWAAHEVGVGRGTDLVLYVLVVTFLLTTATLLRRITDLERRYVDLARHSAIQEALLERRLGNAAEAEVHQ
jgi:hypothetical protein